MASTDGEDVPTEPVPLVPVDLDSYGDIHRATLQLLITSKTIGEQQLIDFLAHSVPDADQSTIKKVLGPIRSKLHPLDLDIASIIEDTEYPETLYVFINKKSTKSLQVATGFSEKEMKVIVHVLGMIFTQQGRHYSVDKYTVESDVREKFGYKLVEVQQLLRRLLLAGWLEVWNGQYTVAPRGLLELQPYVESNFPEVKPCHGCGQLLTRGLACDQCPVRYHRECYRLFVDTSETVCPGCGQPLANVSQF